MKIVISSGHGKYVRGASGILDEVDEARLVVDRVAKELRNRDVEVITFHDDVSQSQNENLNRIVDFHNAQGPHDLDVSVHFNAYVETTKPMGCEVLYVTQSALAADVSALIAEVGQLIDRGGKRRDDLFFLNNTAEKSILIETCFVDSEADAALYEENFDAICDAIATAISGIDQEGVERPDRPQRPDDEVLFQATGKCSHFGGPNDEGVSPSEGLAFIYDVMEAPHLFLPYQPADTTGLARRLNPYIHYVACRWDYSKTPKEMLRDGVALVRVPNTDLALTAFCADWGPNDATGRVADLSPGLLADLGLTTDDEVEVIFPWKEE
jgi:N-acetylmuramoyl-L-alanine amidase